jgi:hypothetical protein
MLDKVVCNLLLKLYLSIDHWLAVELFRFGRICCNNNQRLTNRSCDVNPREGIFLTLYNTKPLASVRYGVPIYNFRTSDS